jgi:hypothetical protein
MPALVAGIHVLAAKKGVDARHKAGHDEAVGSKLALAEKSSP